MDWNKLADELLGIAKASVPLVGLSEEVAAAEQLIAATRAAYASIKDALDPAKRAEVEAGLDALAARVNAHADRIVASLG